MRVHAMVCVHVSTHTHTHTHTHKHIHTCGSSACMTSYTKERRGAASLRPCNGPPGPATSYVGRGRRRGPSQGAPAGGMREPDASERLRWPRPTSDTRPSPPGPPTPRSDSAWPPILGSWLEEPKEMFKDVRSYAELRSRYVGIVGRWSRQRVPAKWRPAGVPREPVIGSCTARWGAAEYLIAGVCLRGSVTAHAAESVLNSCIRATACFWRRRRPSTRTLTSATASSIPPTS